MHSPIAKQAPVIKMKNGPTNKRHKKNLNTSGNMSARQDGSKRPITTMRTMNQGSRPKLNTSNYSNKLNDS